MSELPVYRVMLVLFDSTYLQDWMTLTRSLALSESEVHLRGLVALPAEVSLSEGTLRAQQWRDSLHKIATQDPAIHDEVRVYVDYDPYQRILEEVASLELDLLLIQWSTATASIETINALLQGAPCDVVLLQGDIPHTQKPVLLSLRGGPNITLGLRVAKALAQEASITLFHATDRQRIAPDLKVLMHTEKQIGRVVTAVDDIAHGILTESAQHKAIVLGATFYQPDVQHSGASPLIAFLHENANLPIALVRAWHPETVAYHLPENAPTRKDSLSTKVDRWFAENTFDSSEFSDIRALLALKEKQGLTISLGLPALNEAKTVGNVIETLKKALMDEVPLLDEIVLIDSNSTDDTVKIARSYGIPVYNHPDILPEVGTIRGKGEALWKSLHVLKGDIIAWVDTDITNIHPRFIYGLVGPLLTHPRVQYVKGFYQRPIRVGDKLQAGGGGRVTELVARPWFNLFYPELSGLIQPLAGEYAGRREALERVPFFSGYGVETALLIDLLDLYGLEGIAQTNLELRVHHNQPLVGLSKMAFAILQVFVQRMEARFGLELLDKANRSMKLILQEPERFGLEIAEIADVERPPMISLEAYQRLRGL